MNWRIVIIAFFLLILMGVWLLIWGGGRLTTNAAERDFLNNVYVGMPEDALVVFIINNNMNYKKSDVLGTYDVTLKAGIVKNERYYTNAQVRINQGLVVDISIKTIYISL